MKVLKKLFVSVVVASSGLAAYGQTDLPAGWQALPPEGFLSVANDVLPSATPESEEAIRTHAATLLLDGAAASESPFFVLHQLFEVAEPVLSAEQRNAISTRIEAEGDVTGMTYDDLYHWVELQLKASPHDASKTPGGAAAAVRAWLSVRDMASLQESLYQFDWLASNLTFTPWLRSQQLQGFSVTWQGALAAPQSGEYTFFPSEFDISTAYREYGAPVYFKQSMSVSINGQQVLNATVDEWVRESDPVTLTAGQETSITVVYQYETSSGRADQYKPPLAMLFWEGPGVSKSVVPPEAFSQAGGADPGLTAAYEIELSDRSVTETIIEPNIDHLWYRGMNFVCPHQSLQEEAVAQLWGRTMGPAYWQSLEAEPPAGDGPNQLHYLANRPHMAAYLSAQQRNDFLNELLLYPNHLARMPWVQARAVFHCYRFGAPEAAIGFLGTYLQEHDASATPSLSLDYFEANRARYWYLAVPIFWQRPGFAETLEQDYLELADGSCCLSVAYILAYGHLQQGRFQAWIDALDEQLARDDLSGDVRATWLIARAMAEEIKYGPASRDRQGEEHLLAGRGWLDEARLIAPSPATSLQLSKEWIARLAAEQRWTIVRDELDQSPVVIDGWRDEIGNLEAAASAAAAAAKASAESAYVRELERRRNRAARRGDSASESRLAALIESINSPSTPAE